MRPAFDESKLTAYALGELSEKERAEVERHLTESEEARREVEAIRETAGVLRQALSQEPQDPLTPSQRAAIEEGTRRPIPAWRRPVWFGGALAAAASLAVVALVSWKVVRTSGVPELQIEPSSPPVPAASPLPARPDDAAAPSASPTAQRPVVAPAPPPNATPTAPPASLPTNAGGVIAGTATDATGAPVSGTSVTVTNEASGETRETTTDNTGSFALNGLPPGSYRLDAELQGFKKYERRGVAVGGDGSVQSADVQLEVGEVAEMIQVVAQSEPIQASTGAREAIITPEQIDALSTKNRNTLDPARAPLTATSAAGKGGVEGSVPGGPVTPNAFSINGPRADGLGVTVDGAKLKDIGDNSGMQNVPNNEHVAETKAQTDKYAAMPAPTPQPKTNQALASASILSSLRQRNAPFTTEAYDAVRDNPFIAVAQDPLSTFSIDVDTASYANVRRFLTRGQLPPPGAVRIEELVNTFTYDYAPPRGTHPFAVHLDAAACPWAPDHLLARIALKGREIAEAQRPPSNLVFLIDVSGSMTPANKLPLLRRSLALLVKELDERDRVAIVVYAGASGLVLPSTSAGDKEALLEALGRLRAGGTTHGSAGIRLAYDTATKGFIKGGANRVILATDGDFNVGVTNQAELVQLIEEKAKSGVFLTVLGFGMGNYKDSTLEKLADKGNGNYAYIDSLREARRVLVDQIGGTLVTIAKDVKIQVEFNPARVAEYRLIGYENRILAHQDFDDDTKDAGEIGAGHTVTALYEIVPVGARPMTRPTRPLKYQEARKTSQRAHKKEILTVRLRCKQPDGDTSVLLEEALKGKAKRFTKAPTDLRFASAVAAFGMLLRGSPYKGEATLADVGRWARQGMGNDASGQRTEFLDLVRRAEALRNNR